MGNGLKKFIKETLRFFLLTGVIFFFINQQVVIYVDVLLVVLVSLLIREVLLIFVYPLWVKLFSKNKARPQFIRNCAWYVMSTASSRGFSIKLLFSYFVNSIVELLVIALIIVLYTTDFVYYLF